MFTHLGLRALVLGDLMFDVEIESKSHRLDQVWSVPVQNHVSRRLVPGGAGNVAVQLSRLGFQSMLASSSTKKDHGWIQECLHSTGVQWLPSIEEFDFLPQKERVRSHGSLQSRTDYDPQVRCTIKDPRWAAWIVRETRPQVVVISDYGRGTLDRQDLGNLKQAVAGIRVYGDIRPSRLAAYLKAGFTFTALTPNTHELTEFLPEIVHPLWDTATPAEQMELRVNELGRIFHCSAVVTDGARGVICGGGIRHPVPSPLVWADSTGAGDSFVAGLATNFAWGPVTFAQCVANVACSRPGTSPAYLAEVVEAFPEMRQPMSLDDAKFWRQSWKQAGKPVVITNGCFDLFHPGHLQVLEAAAAFGKVLVLTDTDVQISRLKGPTRPIQPLTDRMRILLSLRCVSGLGVFDSNEELKLWIGTLQPDKLVKGGDWAGKEIIGAEHLSADQVVIVPRSGDWSTSGIIDRARRT